MQICTSVLLLCVLYIVSKTAASAIGFHKYSIAFHMLQPIVSKCVCESELQLRIAIWQQDYLCKCSCTLFNENSSASTVFELFCQFCLPNCSVSSPFPHVSRTCCSQQVCGVQHNYATLFCITVGFSQILN